MPQNSLNVADVKLRTQVEVEADVVGVSFVFQQAQHQDTVLFRDGKALKMTEKDGINVNLKLFQFQ